jgi:hypothetical protein
MDVVVLAVIITMLLGAPNGILLSFAGVVIAAVIRSQGGLRERALGVMRTRFLWASAAFSLAALVLGDWQSVAITWLIAAFAINAWRRQGIATDRDRSRMLARFVAALTGLALAWVAGNWVTTPMVTWLVGVALLAAGVFGMVLRWPALPWFAGPFSPLRALGLTTTVGMCALIVAVPFT